MVIATAGRGSHLFAAMEPELSEWTPDTDLLSAVLWTLQQANWQRGGGRGERPKKPHRPQSRAASRAKTAIAAQQRSTHVGDDDSGAWDVAPLRGDEMAEWLGWT